MGSVSKEELFRVLVAIYQDPDFVSCLVALILNQMEEANDES
jgi:hypothetical protein